MISKFCWFKRKLEMRFLRECNIQISNDMEWTPMKRHSQYIHMDVCVCLDLRIASQFYYSKSHSEMWMAKTWVCLCIASIIFGIVSMLLIFMTFGRCSNFPPWKLLHTELLLIDGKTKTLTENLYIGRVSYVKAGQR